MGSRKGVMRHTSFAGAACIALYLLVKGAGASAVTPTYTITDLGSLGGRQTTPMGINNRGAVVGFASTGDGFTRGFLYTGGSLLDLGTLGGEDSFAYRVSDSGVIVGRAQDSTGRFHAFVTTIAAGTIELASLDPSMHGDFGSAVGVNGLGDVIGYYSAAPQHALDPLDKANLRYRGPDQLLGSASVRPIADAFALGTLPTSAAQNVGLLYDRTGSAVSTDFAVTHGGAALGWDDGAFNSVVSVAVGRGHYLIFGGGIDDEAVLAQDVMRIVSSRLVDATGPVTYAQPRVARRAGHTALHVRLRIPSASPYARISLIDASPLGVDTWHWTARVGSRSVVLCSEPRSEPNGRCARDTG